MTKDELRKHEIYLTNLQPNEFVSNKSFYGKAKSVGINGVGMFLISYSTIVCYIDDKGLHRTWNDWSLTTSRHITAFLTRYAYKDFKRGLSKKEWKELPVEKSPVDIDDIYALCGDTHYSIY